MFQTLAVLPERISIKVPWTHTTVTPEKDKENHQMGEEKDWMGKENQ